MSPTQLRLRALRAVRTCRDFLLRFPASNELLKSITLVVVFLGVTTLFIAATVSLVGLSIALVESSDITLDLEQVLTSQSFQQSRVPGGEDFMLEQIQIDYYLSEISSQG